MLRSLPLWRRIVVYGAYAYFVVWAYSETYHTWTNWTHAPSVVLGMCASWLVIEVLQSAFDAVSLRALHWPQGERLVMAIVSIVGMIAALAMALVDARRFGFAAHDQTAIDIFIGVCASFLRYFLRIRFSHQPTPTQPADVASNLDREGG